ncbi:DGQHR domain-containing protein [Tateyamaria omphalii]|uniref:DGQHR domain-containing protein n=1 Tax=Tateyamaria omphalii TaxID=299262 RepID=UPI001C990E5D|nr:DGQHR domain-containing protein [Tateyamaria omphalii]MBY5933727.1 DGQHR domain-containing protein [Tateyamaria omphalii]
MNPKNNNLLSINALKFTQWLDLWDGFEYSTTPPDRKPKPSMFVFSMNASTLRSYSDVYKRERSSDDVEGIQRKRDEKRTKRIQEFVQYGYPYGDLKENQRTLDKVTLRKPGWLPTAIVVNILEPGDQRKGKQASQNLTAQVVEGSGHCEILLPDLSRFSHDDVRPFEVIDGQHRLWAFEEEMDGQYELPVVAFHGLDIAWQAYLFWSINVSPKRINPSHAFDLYPLLRNQTWLEQTGDLTVYREARAQEITEWLYKHPDSAWKNRINMLGESGAGRVSQAAFVRSLTAAFFGTGRGKAGRHGLFQAAIPGQDEPLSWTRSQQVALVLEFWRLMQIAIGDLSNEEWVAAFSGSEPARDAFDDRSSMLNQDMGVRAAHAVVNDVLYRSIENWSLSEWMSEEFDETDTTEEDVSRSLVTLRNQKFYSKFRDLTTELVRFDWRSLDGPGVRENRDLELVRRAYRGSGGYTLLTNDIMQKLAEAKSQAIAGVASEISADGK